MATKDNIVIYVNKKNFGTISCILDETLEKLRTNLESIIPNDIRFIKNNRILSIESEKDIKIKEIMVEIEGNNSINLNQDYFSVYLDNKIVKIKTNRDLFVNFSLSSFIGIYKEILPSVFDIICKPNLLIRIEKSSYDREIKIRDIIIDQCINVFSIKTKENYQTKFETNMFGFIQKINNNIFFRNVEYKNLVIFDSLLLDDNNKNLIVETTYEKRRKSTLENFSKNKPFTVSNKDFLKQLISEDNTNPDIILEYLNILKNNKDPEFEKELKKYSFLFDVNILSNLDPKFKQEKFRNYYDEKTNLINFLNSVIKGDYNNYTQVNMIISETDYRNTIQKDIESPFINNFDKEKYINCPIQISDNNLFFHYLRVKFFKFLQDAFPLISMFKKFCQTLLDKINSMTKENNPKLKLKLLLEILCMSTIFGFHSEEKENVLYYYSRENFDNEYYYYPIIFFNKVKKLLFEYYQMIGKSNCLKTALIKYKEIINYNSKKKAELDPEKSIKCLLTNIIFIPFFSSNHWGLTIPAFNLSFINIDVFGIQDGLNFPDYIFLFYFVKYIISFIHEPLGHNLKIFESFNNNLETPFNTPRSIEGNEGEVYEGGYLLEKLLFGNNIEYLNIEHVLFILNENNWSLGQETFLERFQAIGNPNQEKCEHLIETGKTIKELLNIFKINKNFVERAIEDNVQIATQYKIGFFNTIKLDDQLEKQRTQKREKKPKKKNERICLTQSFY